MPLPHHTKILYVDDDVDDRYFMSLSLTETGTNADLICASNGEDAIQYLNSTKVSDLPSLIILDLNMPKWDGRKTLNYLKKQPHLANIPVVILTTSNSNTDRESCALLGASSYYTKPYRFDDYKQIISSFGSFLGRS
jgi:CheY-like chemotaxis protein